MRTSEFVNYYDSTCEVPLSKVTFFSNSFAFEALFAVAIFEAYEIYLEK